MTSVELSPLAFSVQFMGWAISAVPASSSRPGEDARTRGVFRRPA